MEYKVVVGKVLKGREALFISMSELYKVIPLCDHTQDVLIAILDMVVILVCVTNYRVMMKW